MRLRLPKIALSAFLLYGAACSSAPRLAPTQASSAMNPLARVDLTNIEDEDYTLMVYNTSNGEMVIERDSFVLQTPDGEIRREPGGIKSFYTVAPGGAHDVRLRFEIAKLPAGTQVCLLVDQAVKVNGQPVGLPPIVLTAR